MERAKPNENQWEPKGEPQADATNPEGRGAKRKTESEPEPEKRQKGEKTPEAVRQAEEEEQKPSNEE